MRPSYSVQSPVQAEYSRLAGRFYTATSHSTFDYILITNLMN